MQLYIGAFFDPWQPRPMGWERFGGDACAALIRFGTLGPGWAPAIGAPGWARRAASEEFFGVFQLFIMNFLNPGRSFGRRHRSDPR